jgi:hypothetical protein
MSRRIENQIKNIYLTVVLWLKAGFDIPITWIRRRFFKIFFTNKENSMGYENQNKANDNYWAFSTDQIHTLGCFSCSGHSWQVIKKKEKF